MCNYVHSAKSQGEYHNLTHNKDQAGRIGRPRYHPTPVLHIDHCNKKMCYYFQTQLSQKMYLANTALFFKFFIFLCLWIIHLQLEQKESPSWDCLRNDDWEKGNDLERIRKVKIIALLTNDARRNNAQVLEDQNGPTMRITIWVMPRFVREVSICLSACLIL